VLPYTRSIASDDAIAFLIRIQAKVLSDDAKRGFEAFVIERVPLGRAGSAEEAAAVAPFLLSDDASYVTGSQYAVDGGLIMQ